MAYQGVFGAEELWKLGFGGEFERNAFLSNGAASAMKAGLEQFGYAFDRFATLRYEIQTPKMVTGLDWLVRQRAIV